MAYLAFLVVVGILAAEISRRCSLSVGQDVLLIVGFNLLFRFGMYARREQ